MREELRRRSASSFGWLSVALVVLAAAAAGCTEDSINANESSNPTQVDTCCQCSCGAGAELCAVLAETRPGSYDCNDMCADECRNVDGCDGSVVEAFSCSGNSDKSDDPCKQTCAVLGECGVTYIDQGTCDQFCDPRDQQTSDVVCVEEASCDPVYLRECLAAMPGALASKVILSF